MPLDVVIYGRDGRILRSDIADDLAEAKRIAKADLRRDSMAVSATIKGDGKRIIVRSR